MHRIVQPKTMMTTSTPTGLNLKALVFNLMASSMRSHTKQGQQTLTPYQKHCIFSEVCLLY